MPGYFHSITVHWNLVLTMTLNTYGTTTDLRAHESDRQPYPAAGSTGCDDVTVEVDAVLRLRQSNPPPKSANMKPHIDVSHVIRMSSLYRHFSWLVCVPSYSIRPFIVSKFRPEPIGAFDT